MNEEKIRLFDWKFKNKQHKVLVYFLSGLIVFNSSFLFIIPDYKDFDNIFYRLLYNIPFSIIINLVLFTLLQKLFLKERLIKWILGIGVILFIVSLFLTKLEIYDYSILENFPKKPREIGYYIFHYWIVSFFCYHHIAIILYSLFGIFFSLLLEKKDTKKLSLFKKIIVSACVLLLVNPIVIFTIVLLFVVSLIS